MFGTARFLYAMTALGIVLSTYVKTMPQFSLLAIPFFVIMNILSGGTSPHDGMPLWLQYLMQAALPSHYTHFAQAVIYRGAGIEVVCPQLVAIVAIGTVLFFIALIRFRLTMSSSH